MPHPFFDPNFRPHGWTIEGRRKPWRARVDRVILLQQKLHLGLTGHDVTQMRPDCVDGGIIPRIDIDVATPEPRKAGEGYEWDDLGASFRLFPSTGI